MGGIGVKDVGVDVGVVAFFATTICAATNTARATGRNKEEDPPEPAVGLHLRPS